MLSSIGKPDYHIALSALLCVMGLTSYKTDNIDEKIKSVKKILRHYKFSNDEIKSITAILVNHLIFIKNDSLSAGKQKKLMRSVTFEQELEFHKMHLNVLNEPLKSHDELKRFYNGLNKKDIFPDPLVTGKDLIARGFSPGPSWGKLLDELDLMRLEGEIVSKKDALEWIQQRIK